jgi:hypothetical protein
LKEYSSKKYGRKREFVDAEISARLWLTSDDTALPVTPEAPFISTPIAPSDSSVAPVV